MAHNDNPRNYQAPEKMAQFSEGDLIKAQADFDPLVPDSVRRWQLCWNWALTKGYTIRPGVIGASIRFLTIVDPNGREIGINAKRPNLSKAEAVQAKDAATVNLDPVTDGDTKTAA